MNIDHPTNRKFVVYRSADGSVLHRVTVGPDQSMATGQPIVEQTESEIEHVGHLAPYAEHLPPLPAEGEPVEAGEVYAYDGRAVMARKGHTRGNKTPKADLFIDAANVTDLNTATKKQLRSLTGVGRKLAQRIIDGRPYASVNDLTAISGITQSSVDGWEVVV